MATKVASDIRKTSMKLVINYLFTFVGTEFFGEEWGIRMEAANSISAVSHKIDSLG